jgi:hypothetical protein
MAVVDSGDACHREVLVNRKIKLACIMLAAGFLVYRTAVVSHAGRDGMESPEVTAEGVIVHAGLNAASDTDPEMYGVVEGSVTFMANVPFQKILDNMLKPGTLGKISPNITAYKADKVSETEDALVYAVEEEVSPLPSFTKAAPAKVWLTFTVNKRALAKRLVFVEFELDKSKPNKWKRLSGRIMGIDQNNGFSTIMVTTSSRSHYEGLPSLRAKVVKSYLAKTKDHIVTWLNTL